MHTVIAGIDGSGKMTQTDLLNKALLRIGEKTSLYSYPDYSSSYGKIIKDEFLYGTRKFPVEELALLFLADITKDKQRVIADLKDGKHVIMDRYCLDTIAYQTAGGFNYESLKRMVELIGLPMPETAFYLDVDPDVSFKRKNKQKESNPDKFERDIKYLNSVRTIYEKMISENYPSKTRWVKIDATKSIDEVHKIMLKELRIA